MPNASDNGAEGEIDEQTKPAFIRQVQILGYKSIAFCDVALQPLTILVGRNASGKSNFLDALAFLRDLVAKGTEEAVRLHGGRRAILPRMSRGTTVSIGVQVGFRQQSTEVDHLADYQVKLRLPSRARPVIIAEHLRIETSRDGKTVGFDRINQDLKWLGDVDLLDWCAEDRLLLSMIGVPPFLAVRHGLDGAGFYNFSPDKIRELHEPTPGMILERDGRNLASVIETTREIDEDIIRRVESYLSALVNEIEGFDVVRYGEYETVRFRFRSNDERKSLELDAVSMSDGTLRALAALMASFQSQLPDSPSLIGIEEPETALHPAAMRVLVDALDEATGHAQILLTTHSADLLTDRALRTAQVLVVRNRGGVTQISPVDPASREIIEKELYTLADLQRLDLLDLDEADLGRQAKEQSRNGGA